MATYERVNWEDSPSILTPINAENLNTMDAGLAALVDEFNGYITGENERIAELNDIKDQLERRIDALCEVPNIEKVREYVETRGYEYANSRAEIKADVMTDVNTRISGIFKFIPVMYTIGSSSSVPAHSAAVLKTPTLSAMGINGSVFDEYAVVTFFDAYVGSSNLRVHTIGLEPASQQDTSFGNSKISVTINNTTALAASATYLYCLMVLIRTDSMIWESLVSRNGGGTFTVLS